MKDNKKIKNYTSQVSVDRTISMIETELVKIGVNKIEKTYTNGVADGIIFSVAIPNVSELSYKLPANIDAAKSVLKEIPEYRKKNKDWLEAQSRRTAWKIIYDWVTIQVAMVMLKQAEADQVFLPYLYNKLKDQTLYQKIGKMAGYKQIGMFE